MVRTADGLAIDLHHVTKVYRGKVHALRGIEMQVRRGEVFGLLGPNGAGKSTLVKIMMTIVRPTRGEGTVLGRAVGHKPTLQRMGYLPENHRFPRYLTGRQTIEFFGALSKVDRPTRKRRTGELLDLVGMTQAADRKIATYSKGMAQRVGLAQALINDPDLIVLDEPTDGVDPGGRRDIRDVMARLREAGKTVFVNSHLLSELEMICDRVAILVAGQVARQGTLDELTVAKQRYEFDFLPQPGQSIQEAVNRATQGALTRAAPAETLAPPAAPPNAGMPLVLPYAAATSAGPSPGLPPSVIYRGTLPGGTWIELHGSTLRVGTTEAADVQGLLDAFRREGLTIRRMQLIRPSLEDLFVEIVARPGAGSSPAASPNGGTA